MVAKGGGDPPSLAAIYIRSKLENFRKLEIWKIYHSEDLRGIGRFAKTAITGNTKLHHRAIPLH